MGMLHIGGCCAAAVSTSAPRSIEDASLSAGAGGIPTTFSIFFRANDFFLKNECEWFSFRFKN
jgi:hypothetical protein